MEDYLPIRKSQLALYKNVPLYCLSNSKEWVLYTRPGNGVNLNQIGNDWEIGIYIHKNDRPAAIKDLMTSLNTDLAREITQKGVASTRKVLCSIVDEALSGPLELTGKALPETIEIMFYGYSQKSELLEALARISGFSNTVVNHSVNVLAFLMLYCCIHDIPADKAKILGLSALLHDIGTTMIEKKIIETDQWLSPGEFEIYRTHPQKGHDMIKKSTQFHKTVAKVALEHHEKLDGTGYPRGISHLSDEGQLIGLIDSYESLTYRDKAFRKANQPFDTMQLLKEEVMGHKYDKEMYKNFCLCLAR